MNGRLRCWVGGEDWKWKGGETLNEMWGERVGWDRLRWLEWKHWNRVAFIDVVSWSAGSNIPHNTNIDCWASPQNPESLLKHHSMILLAGTDKKAIDLQIWLCSCHLSSIYFHLQLFFFEMHSPRMFSNHTDYFKVNTKNIIAFNVHVINLSKMDIEAIAWITSFLYHFSSLFAHV